MCLYREKVVRFWLSFFIFLLVTYSLRRTQYKWERQGMAQLDSMDDWSVLSCDSIYM